MERGKERAELRAQGLKRLMLELEEKRDRLLDEVAHKQGEVDLAEMSIRRIHEIILDINKEEKEAVALEEKVSKERERIAQEKKENRPRQSKVRESIKGEKNSDKGKKTVNRVRRARGAKRAEREEEK